jgi:hypothetical protein
MMQRSVDATYYLNSTVSVHSVFSVFSVRDFPDSSLAEYTEGAEGRVIINNSILEYFPIGY